MIRIYEPLFAAAAQVNEKVWQLPADEEYERQLKSRVSDISNVGGPEAGAITAGLFINTLFKKIRHGFIWTLPGRLFAIKG